MADLAGALEAWTGVLGPEHVLTDERTRAAAETATFATTQRVPAVIRPADREEVQACVRIANRHRTPIYPVSRGKNWGYGSRVPAQDGCVVMELGRLDRIVAYDEQLAYATVEPGVTFRQLGEFLRKQRSRLMMSVPGTTPDASLIGNALERGVGFGPYADRFAHACGLEVVLPTGECIHTGFGRFPNARAAEVSRWGVGPYVDGLFTQSNLGIVTRMTVWLTPIPAYSQLCLFAIREDARLEALIEALRRLKLAGALPDVRIVNDYKAFPAWGRYPWTAAGGETPLPADLRERFRRKLGIGVWNGNARLYSASEELGRAERALIARALEDEADHLVFVDAAGAEPYRAIDERQVARLNRLAAEVPDFSPTTLTDERIAGTYWRKKTPVPPSMDPDRDGCGVLWCVPVLPFRGADVRAAVRIVDEMMVAGGFEPQINLACIAERWITMVIGLKYDRDLAGEDGRALECYDAVLRKLTAEGYIPGRLGVQSMGALPAPRDDYAALLRTLKTALDPNDILAPGRYDFRPDWP